MKTHEARTKRRMQRKLAVSFAHGLSCAIERVLREHPDEIAAFKLGDAASVTVISGAAYRDLETNGFVGPFDAVRDRVQSLMIRRYLMN